MSNGSPESPNDGTSIPSTPGAEPRTAQVIALSELDVGRSGELAAGAGAGGRGAPLVDALSSADHPLRRVKARLTVCVGTTEISIGELLGAREHQVLRLDRIVDQPVDVLLEGHVVARGTLMAVDDHFAVRITELPTTFDGVTSSPRTP